MVTNITSGGLKGIDGYIVTVETDISDGMPVFELSGNLGSEVREARERVRTAVRNAGYNWPVKRITVNLSPSDIRKYGTGYDLPIAISVLCAMGCIGKAAVRDAFVAGELMLSGDVRAVKGILPMAMKAVRSGMTKCIIPKDNCMEASNVDGIEIIGVSSLAEAIGYLRGDIEILPFERAETNAESDESEAPDLANIYGQQMAKRGLELAASGYHNILMVGPPGAGKSMLAKCIPSIMPPLTKEEMLGISSIYSVAGLLDNSGIVRNRPFVSPHHTVTDVALIGGGSRPRPGAVSFASKGVLFMDEFPEFSRRALETLRQPLEERKVTIMRNLDSIEYPADFMLVAAMNPCPCGFYPDMTRCRCTQQARLKYNAAISGPLLDRIDIQVVCERVSFSSLNDSSMSESSEIVRKRVSRAHLIQRNRFSQDNILFNSQMDNTHIKKYCRLSGNAREFINSAAEKNNLSARSYYRILRLARTIADLDDREDITVEHLAEAVRYKCAIDM